MELAGPVIQVLQWISEPISKCWKYSRGLNENVETLRHRMGELNSRKSDIQSRLNTEIVQGETELKHEVQNWLQMVEKIGADMNTINENAETVRCFARAGLGKNVIQKIEQVKELHRKGEFPDGLVIRLPQQIGEMQPTPTLGGETTFQRKIEDIWAFLMGDEVRKIGVYGMGGIGKTTVMKYINNRLIEKKEKFDGVIWVTVSKAASIIKLQDAIARQIGVDISRYDDEASRAVKLYAELSEKKRCVLILDDLWAVYRLDEVGIPEPSDQNENKLVLTTRVLDVCLGMNCKPVPMEHLLEPEALKMFLDTVGHDVLAMPNMEVIVNQVVQECARLPLAIVTIAGSLKGIVDYNDWKTTLEDLRGISAKGTNEILDKLKLSYDRLNDTNLQACLLYCALFPEDWTIERDMLVEYLIAEEIIKGRNRQAELERGQAMLNKLVRACLLEETWLLDEIGEERPRPAVKMHDLIRDMALQITSDGPRFLVEAGTGLKFIPDEENWKEDIAKISLMSNAISDIPSSFEPPRCPTLSTLLLNGNPYLCSISNNFFLHMKQLSLLDLSYTALQNLPESIFELVNLNALLLKGCRGLSYVPSLAKLTALKRLDFYGSGIKQVPEGMENLIRLRYLEFDMCHQLNIIPDGILCKLSNLRFLSLLLRWGPTIRGEELVYLRKLECVYCILHDLDSFNAYARSLTDGGPTNYILQLGPTNFLALFLRKESKTVCLSHCNISEDVERGGDCPLLLPPDVESLFIENCRINVSNLWELTSFENVKNLRKCYIEKSGELEHLFLYSSGIVRLLQTLEEICLEKLWNLRGLIKRENVGPSSPLPPGAFCSLKRLSVFNCPKITRLFVNADPLPVNLESIMIVNCERLVEIISTTSGHNNDDEEEEEDQDEEAGRGSDHPAAIVTLPKLWRIHLYSLPKLKSLPVVADHSLRQVFISNCPKLKRVPCLDREQCPPSLERVEIDEDVWGSLEWDYLDAKDAIQQMRLILFQRWRRTW